MYLVQKFVKIGAEVEYYCWAFCEEIGKSVEEIFVIYTLCIIFGVSVVIAIINGLF